MQGELPQVGVEILDPAHRCRVGHDSSAGAGAQLGERADVVVMAVGIEQETQVVVLHAGRCHQPFDRWKAGRQATVHQGGTFGADDQMEVERYLLAQLLPNRPHTGNELDGVIVIHLTIITGPAEDPASWWLPLRRLLPPHHSNVSRRGVG